jgi:hypothetical protein
MKESYLEDENCEFERKETKENRTKSKIKEYFKKNDSLIKKNFNNFLIFIGLGQIWSTESEQKLLWDRIVSYTINKNNVDYEAVLCGISDFFEEEEDEIYDENNKSNDNDSLIDIDLQSLHMKSNLLEDESIKDNNNENCIDEFINSIKDKQEIIYGIKFINEIYFNKYLECDNLDVPFMINKDNIFNEIQKKYKFINIPHDILEKYFNYIKSDSIDGKDEFFIDKSFIKYINVILNNENEDNKSKYSTKSLYSNPSINFINNKISLNLEKLSLMDSYINICIEAMIDFSNNRSFLELAKKYVQNYINNIKNSIYNEIKMKENKYEEKIAIIHHNTDNYQDKNENIVIENCKLKKQNELLIKENLSLAKELEELNLQKENKENENDQKQKKRKSLTPRKSNDGQNNLPKTKNIIFIPPLKFKEQNSDRNNLISTEHSNELSKVDTLKNENSNFNLSKSKLYVAKPSSILQGNGTSSFNDICFDELTNSQFNFSPNINNITDQFLLDTTRLCNEGEEDKEEQQSNKAKKNEKDKYSGFNSQRNLSKKKYNNLNDSLNSDISRIKSDENDENDEFYDNYDEEIDFGQNINNKYTTYLSDNNIRYTDVNKNKKANKNINNYNRALTMNGSNNISNNLMKKRQKYSNEDIFYGYVNKTVKDFYDFKYLNHVHKVERLLSRNNDELINNEFFSDEIYAYFLNSKKKKVILLLTYKAFYFLKNDESLELILRKSNNSLESMIVSTKNFNLVLLSFNGGTDIIIETYLRIDFLKFFQKIINKGKFSKNLNITSSNQFFFHKRNGTLENVPTIKNKTFIITPNFENAHKVGILLKYKESFFSGAFQEKLVVLSSIGLMYFDENNKTPKAIIPIIGTTIKFIVVQVNKLIFCLKMKTINDDVYIFGSLKKKEIFDWMKKLAYFKKVYHMKMKEINPKFIVQNSKELSNIVDHSL